MTWTIYNNSDHQLQNETEQSKNVGIKFAYEDEGFYSDSNPGKDIHHVDHTANVKIKPVVSEPNETSFEVDDRIDLKVIKTLLGR